MGEINFNFRSTNAINKYNIDMLSWANFCLEHVRSVLAVLDDDEDMPLSLLQETLIAEKRLVLWRQTLLAEISLMEGVDPEDEDAEVNEQMPI